MKEVFHHFSKNNRKIIKLSNALSSLQNNIIKKLGKDDFLFYDYEEKTNHTKSLMAERFYLQGLVDGIRISKFYKRFSKEKY
jgi:hypothetical protein